MRQVDRAGAHRFDFHRLTADARPKEVYEYWVTGSGQFPFDMLRYDAAWPIGSEDAHKIGIDYPNDAAFKRRSIHLRSFRMPTIDRWSSFTWSVGAYSLEEKAS